MAFSNLTMSFGGADTSGQNTATLQRNLFLKVFSGEVLTAYDRAVKIAPLLTTRTISSGKSAQFPSTGYAAARYFSQGHNILDDSSTTAANAYLSTIKQSERIIYIDELLVSSCFISQLDEAMSHYDYRATFATELGRALARHQDKYALQIIHDAATSARYESEHATQQVGTEITAATALTSSSALLDAIYDAAKELDQKDVPKEDRFIVLNPTGYYLLLKAGVLTVPAVTDSVAGTDANSVGIQNSYSDSRMLFGASGNDYPSASITMVAGMPVIMSNNTDFGDATPMEDDLFGDTAPEIEGSFNLSATTNAGTQGAADAGTQATTAALVFHKGCAGVVRLKDITMESEYMIERQGTLMVAKLASGMGRLRNQGAVRIKTG